MKRTVLGVVAASAVVGAVVIPSIALGNARRTEGSLAAIQAAVLPLSDATKAAWNNPNTKPMEEYAVQ